MEGGSLSKLPGLIREARDLQGIKESDRARREGRRRRRRREAGALRPRQIGRRWAVVRRRKDLMARVYVSSVINARSDRVWARIRDFNGLPNWHPAIAESRIENGEPADKIGCVRDFRLRNGDRIRERLLGLSDHDLFCTYSILKSPMGVVNYVATLRLTPVTDGERTFAEWTAEFDCAPEREAELVATSAPACSRAASTRSSARSEARCDAARREEHHHRCARRPGVGGAARLQRP